MKPLSRRGLLIGASCGLVASAGGIVGRRLGNLDGLAFRSLEATTGLRREIWPVGQGAGGWKKFTGNPVLGGGLGVCFDAVVLRDEDRYRMWFSWRTRGGIGHAVSRDGVSWEEGQLVFAPHPNSTWRVQVNRPKVVKLKDRYRMWYTGQTTRHSAIGVAESTDGIAWQDLSSDPVFASSAAWERGSVMAPDVILDGDTFKMWYSAGGQFEPVAIGYAESQDGIRWVRRSDPVFSAAAGGFDSARVAGASIVKQKGEYVLFYIGFRNIEESAICIAKSKNGIDGWARHPANPIITPGKNPLDWDYDAAYKPTVLQEANRWLLWYNGRRHEVEQIGLAIHPGLDLGL